MSAVASVHLNEGEDEILTEYRGGDITQSDYRSALIAREYTLLHCTTEEDSRCWKYCELINRCLEESRIVLANSLVKAFWLDSHITFQLKDRVFHCYETIVAKSDSALGRIDFFIKQRKAKREMAKVVKFSYKGEYLLQQEYQQKILCHIENNDKIMVCETLVNVVDSYSIVFPVMNKRN